MRDGCDCFVRRPPLRRGDGAAALRRVLVLLGAAPAEVHPAHVVPVADPVAGVHALQVLNHGHAARGSCKAQGGRKQAVTLF